MVSTKLLKTAGITVSSDGLSETAPMRAVSVMFCGRADAGHDILALRVHKELAVERVGAGRGVAREGHAGRRSLAHVAEHHGLNGDGGAPGFGDRVQAPIGSWRDCSSRTRTPPRWRPRVGLDAGPAGKAAQVSAQHLGLVALRSPLPVGGQEIRVEHVAPCGPCVLSRISSKLCRARRCRARRCKYIWMKRR